jgi:head-tail adaptor
MTTDFDPSGDFGVVADLQESVTLMRPGSSGSWPLERAVAAAVRASEARASGGKFTENDVVWHLDASELTVDPRPGDVLLDGRRQRWTVLAARRTVTGRWRCVCRNLAILHLLDQYVDIEVAVRTKDAAGAEVLTWRSWRTGVAARVQPVRVSVENRHGGREAIEEVKVYVADRIDVDHTHRIKTPEGVAYEVVETRNADRIDSLMEVLAVRNRLSADGGGGDDES